MAAILQTTFSTAFSSIKIFVFWLHLEIFQSFIPNASGLSFNMALQQTGHKPLPEPMLTQFFDVYMQGQASMS